ncbi:MAG TPA: heavy metal translocating P-type ATPase [Candidatus Hydrogenedentes bacterium]|nr:heavy metal translocating P-type ATPase [Candidatus Hydrogenedentota bacterium]
MKQVSYKIEGMDCAEEVAVLKSTLAHLPGVDDLGFDILNGKMTVSLADDATGTNTIVEAVQRTGMRAIPWEESKTTARMEGHELGNSRTRLTVLSGAMVGLGFLTHGLQSGVRAALAEDGGTVPLASKLFFSTAIVAGVWFVVPKAWYALRRFRPDMNLLMVIAISGAVFINEWPEAAMVAFLFALSNTLESWSVGRARRAVAALMALTPPKARVLHDQSHATNEQQANGNHEHMTDVADVHLSSTVLVKPGEKFPLDGKIIKGETAVNQAPITGESMPVSKAVGDDVFAGTINGDGAIEFVTTKLAGDTTVARIIRMVGDAQSRRSPSEQWVETFARWYTPAVMILALGVILVPPLLLNGLWSKWFYEGLVLLVIACPCALVISTPVSIVSALASAARHGVLIKGGLFVELPARLKAVAMDKTGTLTMGRPEVKQIVPLSGHTDKELIEIAAAIESQSEHPLAHAVISYANSLNIRPKPAESFQVLKGKGATAMLDSVPVWIGSHRYLEERGQETGEMHSTLEDLSSAGTSVLIVGNDEHVCGFISVADAIRPNAKATVDDLKAAGIEHVIMLTGDNLPTAEVVARQTGVDETRAELLPEDKVSVVEELVVKYRSVAMIGDGVNDAPAMARATLGIAMGAAGTDAAIETADIALMSDDLSRLPWLVRHSRRTLTIIKQNIVASLAVKAIFVVSAFSGHASLWAAIAADTGMALLVVLNALRLLSSELPDSEVARTSSATRKEQRRL